MAMLYRRPKHSLGHMFRDYYHGLLGDGWPPLSNPCSVP
jgi:hypothetical protein